MTANSNPYDTEQLVSRIVSRLMMEQHLSMAAAYGKVYYSRIYEMLKTQESALSVLSFDEVYNLVLKESKEVEV